MTLEGMLEESLAPAPLSHTTAQKKVSSLCSLFFYYHLWNGTNRLLSEMVIAAFCQGIMIHIHMIVFQSYVRGSLATPAICT